MAEFKRIQDHKSKQDICYKKIKQMIIEGELPAGTLMVERHLCDMLEISRTPVREALQMLCKENLVTSFPGKGMIVSDITIKDVMEIYKLREVIDVLALELFLSKPENITKIQEMRIHTDNMLRMKDCGDYRQFVDEDLSFHYCYLYNTGNSRLQQFAISLSDQIYRIIHTVKTPDQYDITYAQHERIITAIEEHDFAKACEQLRQHMLASKEYHIKRLSE